MDKKSKAFTLIELIAVLVILAVIALIVMPLIMNTVKRVKISANKRSVDGYGRAVELAVATYLISEGDYPTSLDNLTVEYTGNEVICNIKILNKDGSVYLSECSVGGIEVKDSSALDGWYHYGIKESDNDDNQQQVVTEKFKTGLIVYYNPESNEKCSEEDAVSITGTKTGCMKWHTFNDQEGVEEVNLILDHNTTALTSWNSNNVVTSTDEILEKLDKDTETWNSELNVRLISASEISQITGNTNFNEKTSDAGMWFYFDTNNQNKSASATSKSNYAFLFDNTGNCLENGCDVEDNNTYLYDEYSSNIVSGYWTLSPVYNTNEKVWIVNKSGSLNSDSVNNKHDYGIRPVITVKKSIIK